VIKRILVGLVALFGLIAVPAAAQTPAAPTSYAPPPVTPDNVLVLDLTTGGRVRIQLRPDLAPNHVERIKLLAKRGFYDGVIFHRVIEGFMAQTGDPTGTGQGGSELPDLKAEFNYLPHVRGTMAMARADSNDSANSQFFIMFMPLTKLDGKYTVVGRVLDGMQFVDAIPRGEPPAAPASIVRAFIEADGEHAPVPRSMQPPVPVASPTPPAAETPPPAVETPPAAEVAPAPAPEAAPAPEVAPAPEAAPAPEVAPAPEAAPPVEATPEAAPAPEAAPPAAEAPAPAEPAPAPAEEAPAPVEATPPSH